MVVLCLKNPEYEKCTQIWGEPEADTDGKPVNESAPKEVRLDENGKVYFVK